ncbi:YDC1 [Symbiodinium microadriaticum]|nr:YDC1 [Symbiodinium microadriaticum]
MKPISPLYIRRRLRLEVGSQATGSSVFVGRCLPFRPTIMANATLSAPSYWGEINAMHQFCEEKYVVSPYVAEFWNSLSNIPFFCVPAAYCLYRGQIYDMRVKMIWISMFVVGLGSFMFHGTMRFEWEMWDEVPMFLLVLSAIVSKDDVHWMTSGIWKHLIHLLSFGAATVGMCMYLLRGDYEIFLHSFTVVVLLDLILSFVCTQKADLHGSHIASGLIIGYAASLGVGRLLWEIERQACRPGHGGATALLHVLWHFLAGLSVYFGSLSDAQVRYAAHGEGNAVDDARHPWPLVNFVGPGYSASDLATPVYRATVPTLGVALAVVGCTSTGVQGGLRRRGRPAADILKPHIARRSHRKFVPVLRRRVPDFTIPSLMPVSTLLFPVSLVAAALPELIKKTAVRTEEQEASGEKGGDPPALEGPQTIAEVYALCKQLSEAFLLPISEVKACYEDFRSLDIDGNFALSAEEFELAVRKNCHLKDDEPLPANLAVKYAQMDNDGNCSLPEALYSAPPGN